jgi:hypothetical protein
MDVGSVLFALANIDVGSLFSPLVSLFSPLVNLFADLKNAFLNLGGALLNLGGVLLNIFINTYLVLIESSNLHIHLANPRFPGGREILDFSTNIPARYRDRRPVCWNLLKVSDDVEIYAHSRFGFALTYRG